MAKKKSRANSPAARRGLAGSDRAVLAAFARGNVWLRSVLCTLARRGVALRHDNPARARMLLAELSVYPLFKAGRFLFDLLELEDFMIDGAPPPIVATTLDTAALLRLTDFLNQLRAAVDGGIGSGIPRSADFSGEVTAPAMNDNLPPLEAGYYLYEDVVLGAIATSGPLIDEAERAR